MTNQEKGVLFETITKDFFVGLLERIGFIVTKARAQKNGSQHGFDILIIVSKDYTENKIFIECKNYDHDLPIGNILRKGVSLEANYDLDENDLFIAISPKSNFANEDNSEKLSPILSNKFPFSYYALDLSNGIKELFALDKAFFKELYGEEVNFDIDEDKELRRFESIIFSRKPFKKIIIKAEDKMKFIGDLSLDENYIERTFSEELRRDVSYFKDDSPVLGELLKDHKRIFILGNPGSGKSTELIKLALANWAEGEVNSYVPIFKSLKDFTANDTIESYLPPHWTELRKILLIFDGIDEIQNIESFKSEFQNFLEYTAHGEKDIKYVISCRTNIYESVVMGISEFKIFYLQDLNYDQGIELLQKKCTNFVLESKFNTFLKTPFLIDILAEYILDKNEGPSSTANLWKVYIDKRLAHDRKNKLVKISIDPMLIKKYSRKTALINELMKSSVFDEENLYSIVKESSIDLKEFKKNPLLDKIANQETWFFEHKNIQEYFAAMVLSKLSFEKIKDFIVVKESNRTHPSLFNTISFLLNILDGKSYEDLANWLIENEQELLFKADSDRTDAFKVKVFQEYFSKQCIEKGFWIGTNRTFSTAEIAKFGDCDVNLNYLLDFIKDDTYHFRVVISALNLLEHFIIGKAYHKDVKDLFIEKLANKDILKSIKSAIIRCITHLNFLAEDEGYLYSICEIFREENNKEINNVLLSMIRNYQKIDDLFWYIKVEFLRVHNILKRNDDDEVLRGNNWTMEELILKLKDLNNFIELITYYFNDKYKIAVKTRFYGDLLERFLEFNTIEDDFIEKLLKAINGKLKYYGRDNLLVDIIVKGEKELQASVYLLEHNTFGEVKDILARIANERTLELIKDHYKNQLLTSDEIHLFLTYLWRYQRQASYKFELLMQGIGFKFDQPLSKEDNILELQAINNIRYQHNFDILFDRQALLNKIEVIFKENNAVIDIMEVRKIENKWYDNDKNWHGSLDTSISLLGTVIDAYGPSTFEDVVNNLQDGLVQFYEIEEQVKLNVNSNIRFSVSQEQENAIKSWCIKASEEIDFDRIIIKSNENHFFYGPDYSKFRTIFNFLEKYDFELPKDFLLNSLQHFDTSNEKQEEDFFNKLLGIIGDSAMINQRIVSNINNGNLLYSAKESHINYALDHNLKDAFDKIKEDLQELDTDNFAKKIEKYIEKTDDIDLLKKCCNDVSSHKCWFVIAVLLKRGQEIDFCVNKAIEYLELPIDIVLKYHIYEALLLLFQQNKKEAIIYYAALLKHDLSHLAYHSKYSVPDYETLEEMFFEIYSKGPERNKFNNSEAFLTSYVSNLSETDEGYKDTQRALDNIKKKLNKKDHDTELFQVHLLLDHSTNGFINSKSKSMKFESALQKVEEIIN
ncbi:NACHT domain-containing protein [Flavobacterium sp. LB2R40]|uniref:NACHT domain-containing protein n=1 Tax=Flavobacterium sp. LB2R40 TaxID=3401722 RepID=UPI003AAFB3BB